MVLQPDTLFDKRYQLERLLGRGGFSEVWLARDSYTKLEIAIKVYAPGQGMDSNGLADFSAELAGVFNLNHTNLLKPTHVDDWEGMPYLIMSYCSRGSLSKQIGKLSEQELWHVIHDVAAGLAYLHQNDIVHQDIKPDNILIDEQGNYVITDFGISTKARSTLRKSVIGGTVSGGTMAYMGPERFSKQPAPTKASDIWSLGAMMFELITGNVPFGEMGGGMQKGGAEIPEITAPVSEKLRKTIESMLALEPWDRPTAEQLIAGNGTSTQQATGRTTQRFEQTPPASSASFAATEIEGVSVNNVSNQASKPWRWIPIVEMIGFLPFLIGCIMKAIHVNYAVINILLYGSVALCLILYGLFVKLTINGGYLPKLATNFVSVCAVIYSSVVIVIANPSYIWFFPSVVYGGVCLTIWFVFKKRIPEETASFDRKRKIRMALLFILLLGIFFSITVGLSIARIVHENKIAHQESVARFNADMAAASVNKVLPLRLAWYTVRHMDDIERYDLYFGEKPSKELKKDLAKKVVSLYNTANYNYNFSRTTKDKNYYLKQRDSLDRIMWNDMYIQTEKTKSNHVVQYKFMGEDYSVE